MDQVKAMLADLRDNYIRDLPSRVDDIEQLLLDLEKDGFQIEVCRELYRQVHSLKGSGGTYGLDFLSDICHPLEDLLSSLIEHPGVLSQGFIEHGLAYVDLMRKTCATYAVDLEPSHELKLTLHSLRQKASRNRHSALIVEGSEVVVGMIKESLLEHGFRIEIVRDGYLALGRILAEPYDLLITGYENKRLNGLALISAVQKSGLRVAKTKTILLTTKDIEDAHVRPDFVVKKNATLKTAFRQILDETDSSLH